MDVALSGLLSGRSHPVAIPVAGRWRQEIDQFIHRQRAVVIGVAGEQDRRSLRNLRRRELAVLVGVKDAEHRMSTFWRSPHAVTSWATTGAGSCRGERNREAETTQQAQRDQGG